MERRVRRALNQERKFRYKKTTTTGNGASDGSTVISTNLTELDDHWNGCLVSCLDGSFEGSERIVEDFTASSDTLTFTNNVFPGQVLSGTSIEITERGTWTGRTIEQALKDSINFIASIVPKAFLASNGYVFAETVGSVAGVAAPPANALDIHHITINGKPAVPVPVERIRRLISGQDSYLDPVGTTRYLYVFEGKDADESQLRHFPASNASVVYHKVPLFTDFDSNGATSFPDTLFSAVVYYATGILWDINESADLAQKWEKRALDDLQARGIKITIKAKQEGRK